MNRLAGDSASAIGAQGKDELTVIQCDQFVAAFRREAKAEFHHAEQKGELCRRSGSFTARSDCFKDDIELICPVDERQPCQPGTSHQKSTLDL